jgi:salicylate hydroxylase
LSARTLKGRRQDRPILIAGGGIGGLAAAIALGRRGLGATVLERSDFAEESGAGIQLGPNATSVLRQLGVLESIAAASFSPEAIWLFDAPSGRLLASLPLGTYAEKRYGAPYLTFHRADLHAGLVAACKGLASVKLRPRFELAAVEQAPDTVVARSADGRAAEASCLIGADGLWSGTRALVAPDARLRFAGATAWRALLPRVGLPSPYDAPVIGVWLGPSTHLVHYPIRGGKDLNVVAVVDGGKEARGWNQPGESDALLAHFARWSKDSKSLLEMASSWRCWSLHRLAPLRSWSAGRITLLGDAAHPVLPYLAQGAALAIEDAIALAASIASLPGDPAAAFLHYEALRRQRVARVQQEAERFGRRYHMSGPLRLARNLVLKHRSGEALLGSLDWLYGA